MSLVPTQFRIYTKCKKYTTNNHRPEHAQDKLQKYIINGKISDSNVWAAELVVSGMINLVWDTIFEIYYQNINIINPPMGLWIFRCYHRYLDIKKNYRSNLRNLCNDQEIRNMIAEILTILCISEKNFVNVSFKNVKNVSDNRSSISSKANKIAKKYVSKYIKTDVHKGASSLASRLENIFAYMETGEVHKTLPYIVLIIKNPKNIKTDSSIGIGKASVKSSPVWILWHYITSNFHGNKDMLNVVINTYVINHENKNYLTCVLIVYYALLLDKLRKNIKYNSVIPHTNHKVMKAVLDVNIIYKSLHK